jgi:hypothetical protein
LEQQSPAQEEMAKHVTIMMVRIAMWGAILQRRYSEQEWDQMWCEKWNAARDMSNYVSQRAAQVMMSPQSDNMDAVESVLQTTLTTLHVLEKLEFDDCFPSSLLPPPYVAPPWTSQDLPPVFIGTGDDVSSGCGKSAGKSESDGCGKRPRLQLRSEHIKVYSTVDSIHGIFDNDDESKGGKYKLKCLSAETVASGRCNLMCTPEASEPVHIGGCNILVPLSTAARVASESPPGIPLLSMLFLQPGASLTRLAAKQALLLDRVRLEEFKTGAIQCPEDEVAALIPHFGGAKVCDVGARCDLDSAGGTFGHHDDSTPQDSDCFSRGDCNEGSYCFSGCHENGNDTSTDFGSKPTEFVLSQLSACQMGKQEPASPQPGETILELGQYTTSLNQLDRYRQGLSQGRQECHSGQCQLNQSLDWCPQVAVTARPEAARPVTAPGEMVQVITPGLTVPASAISESGLAGHSSVNVSIGLVSDGSEPAESATVSVKSITTGLELVSARLKSSKSVFDGTLPVHDVLGSVTDPITTDQGSDLSPDRSGCSVLVGPTRKGSSRPRNKTIPWQLQTLLMIPWLDRSSVRILIMVLLFFILNLSFPYGPSCSTTLW